MRSDNRHRRTVHESQKTQSDSATTLLFIYLKGQINRIQIFVENIVVDAYDDKRRDNIFSQH